MGVGLSERVTDRERGGELQKHEKDLFREVPLRYLGTYYSSKNTFGHTICVLCVQAMPMKWERRSVTW